MIITVGQDKTITISDFQRKVICDLINRDEFDEVIFIGICEFINRIYTSSLKNLNNSWREKLDEEKLSPELLAEAAFAHPDYKDRLEREVEAQSIRTSTFEIQ